MKQCIKMISCFLCCLMTLLSLCSCQTDAVSRLGTDTNSQSNLLGDADCDGEVTIIDATTIQRHLAQLLTLSESAQKLADVNNSTEVDITDATFIQRFLASLDVPYGIGKAINNDSENNSSVLEQTGFTDQVPSSYLNESQHGGTIQRIDYASKDYADSGSDITKQAYVYLPYGYDENDTDTR